MFATSLRSSLQSRLPEYMVPSAFVLLEELPLTHNGKVNRSALPAPDSATAGEGYVAPATPTESAMTKIWAEVLSMDAEAIGTKSDFFDLGGNSILAIHLISMASKYFGNILELRDIFAMRSVHEMSGYIDTHQHLQAKSTSRRSNLLELKSKRNDSAKPLFLVHPVSGYAHCYSELVSHLDYPGPVFGLQIDGVDFPETIEAMAGKYITAIQHVQPQGSYLIGGWSMGGVVAYEMVQQLNAAQEKVDLLLMLDSYCPSLSNNHTSRSMPVEDERSPLEDVAAELGVEKDTLDKMSLDDLLATVLRLGHEQNHLPASFGMHELKERYIARLASTKALRAYVPSPVGEEIHLIRAAENQETDWVLGWGSLGTKVSVTEQSGGHSSMIYDRPHVLALAKTIDSLIRRHAGETPESPEYERLQAGVG
jgi:thioesterase domain-containing protein/acyl carrier protein